MRIIYNVLRTNTLCGTLRTAIGNELNGDYMVWFVMNRQLLANFQTFRVAESAE